MFGRLTGQAWRLTRLPCSASRVRASTELNSFLACQTTRYGVSRTAQAGFATVSSKENVSEAKDAIGQYTSKEVQERIEELQSSAVQLYPRHEQNAQTRSIRSFEDELDEDDAGTISESSLEWIQVSGRISSIRLSGSKLAFIDIVEDQIKLQVMLSYSTLDSSIATLDDFKNLCRLLRRGDYISLKGGRPYKAKNGQISIKAATLPEILSPCLQRFPVEQRGFATSDLEEANYRPRHVEMLTDPEVIETLKARSVLVRTMRNFFDSHGFVEVATPILSAAGGGATAKPFETKASEFSDRKLSLRIAPELWLKRLIVGGMDRIFEIGPSFRNEGLDKTHNPEFTTCEFYAVGHDLPHLMDYTKRLLVDMAQAMKSTLPPHSQTPELTALLQSIEAPFQEVDFIPALNSALGFDLPNLSSATAKAQLLEIFRSKDLPLPSNPTVPRLVDKLASIYLEPRSLDSGSGQQPLWITNIPECLSPLAKSYEHPTAANAQRVAARAELFIQGKEVVNCYEEENSPFEQRRKFVDQQRLARRSDENDVVVVDDEAMPVDEDYLRALEWGLPPTGGWGCGIDRLIMLFTGKERIGDVLTFGNLRAVTRGAERD